MLELLAYLCPKVEYDVTNGILMGFWTKDPIWMIFVANKRSHWVLSYKIMILWAHIGLQKSKVKNGNPTFWLLLMPILAIALVFSSQEKMGMGIKGCLKFRSEPPPLEQYKLLFSYLLFPLLLVEALSSTVQSFVSSLPVTTFNL